MSEKKQEFENLKRTTKAHGTLSEETAEVQAKETRKVTEDLIKKESEKAKSQEKVSPVAVKEEKREKTREEVERERVVLGWEPKTKLGIEVKNGKITDIDEILDSNRKILEEQIVDSLVNIKTDLILIGQAKGKFGGGKRRAWRQTQKKTKEGNIPAFSAMAVIGDENGHVGIGVGKAKETLPARDKAIRNAKLNIIKIKRACSGFDCACSELHTVLFKVKGKTGSVKLILIPAPQGTGLVVGKELKKILKLAGIKDVYSKTFGKKRTTFNVIKACFDALNKTTSKKK